MITTITLIVLYLLSAFLWPQETRSRTRNLLIALDQLAYVLITLGKGAPDETMSAAAYRLWLKGHWAGRVFKPLIDAIFRPLERDHCEKAFWSEVRGSQLHESYREIVPKGPGASSLG